MQPGGISTFDLVVFLHKCKNRLLGIKNTHSGTGFVVGVTNVWGKTDWTAKDFVHAHNEQK